MDPTCSNNFSPLSSAHWLSNVKKLDVSNEIKCVALETRNVLVESKVRAGILRRAHDSCSCIQPYLTG